MRVIMDNGGAKTHTVNDKAQISHEIEKKTTLDKKCGGALEKRQERTVGNTAKANTTRGSPSAVQRKAAHFSKQQTHIGNTDVKSENVSVSTSETKQTANSFPTAAQRKAEYFSKSQEHSGNTDVKSENVSVSTSETKQTANSFPTAAQRKAEYFSKSQEHSGNTDVKFDDVDVPISETKQVSTDFFAAAQQKAEHFSKQTPRRAETMSEVHHEVSSKGEPAKPRVDKPQEKNLRTVGKLDKTAIDKKKLLSPEAMERRQRKFKNKRLKLAPQKHYKVLENGVVNTGEITKKKARTIYSQVPLKLQNDVV